MGPGYLLSSGEAEGEQVYQYFGAWPAFSLATQTHKGETIRRSCAMFRDEMAGYRQMATMLG